MKGFKEDRTRLLHASAGEKARSNCQDVDDDWSLAQTRTQKVRQNPGGDLRKNASIRNLSRRCASAQKGK